YESELSLDLSFTTPSLCSSLRFHPPLFLHLDLQQLVQVLPFIGNGALGSSAISNHEEEMAVGKWSQLASTYILS
ncbi:unnamed protein product, partial [Linum tenue]